MRSFVKFFATLIVITSVSVLLFAYDDTSLFSYFTDTIGNKAINDSIRLRPDVLLENSIKANNSEPSRSITPLNSLALRDLKVETRTIASAVSQVTVGIDYEAVGTEFGLGFSVNFNQNYFQYDSTAIGGTIPGWTVLTNSSNASNGNLQFGLSGDIATFTPLSAGASRLMTITFNVRPAARCGVTSPITVSGSPMAVIVADTTGNQLSSPTLVAGGITVTPNPINFTTTATLPAATIGSAYSQSLAAAGGSGTISGYAVTGGTLPSGLTLSSAGTLSGTPTASGSSSFTVTATDSNGCTGSQTFSLTTSCPTVSISPNLLAAGTQFSAYTAQTLTASGTTGTVTWTVSSGALPAGLLLAAGTGILSGTPTVNGAFNFTIRAQDASGCVGQRSYSLTINCPAINLGSLGNGTAGVSYSGSVAVTSPSGTYIYAVSAGSLPTGLSLNSSTGAITGVPTLIGSYSFTVTATGLGSCTGSRVFNLQIGCPTITLSPQNLPTAITKIPYSQSLNAAPAGIYQYALTSGALPPGLTLNSSSGLLAGIPTTPGNFSFTITATGWGSCTGSLSLSLDAVETNVPPVTGNPATPILPTPNLGPGGVVTLTQTLTNNIPFSFTTSFTATLPDGLTLLPGSCSAPFGTCQVGVQTIVEQGSGASNLSRKSLVAAVMAPQTLSWNGTIPPNGSITITYLAQVGTQAVSGTRYCVTTMIGGTPGPSTCLTVTAPQSGPGIPVVATGPSSAQKPGSILIYNLYTSSINPAQSDTRVAITNTNQVNPVFVHLFFVDGANCSVTGQFISLTQNQTVSFSMSDIDPAVTGYIIAVATDRDGCPIIHNDLVGESFVKFESGHKANIAAIGVSGLSAGSTICTPNAVAATLAFDGSHYNVLPRTLAVDSLPPPATGNSSLLVVNRIGGNLTGGLPTLGTISGLLFDDLESSQSFVLPGGSCQLRGVLGNNFPRTVPRYTTVIPAGRTGWMKFAAAEDQALTGVVINESSNGFSGGHNLHTLTTTSTATLTIPVFPAR